MFLPGCSYLVVLAWCSYILVLTCFFFSYSYLFVLSYSLPCSYVIVLTTFPHLLITTWLSIPSCYHLLVLTYLSLAACHYLLYFPTCPYLAVITWLSLPGSFSTGESAKLRGPCLLYVDYHITFFLTNACCVCKCVCSWSEIL